MELQWDRFCYRGTNIDRAGLCLTKSVPVSNYAIVNSINILDCSSYCLLSALLPQRTTVSFSYYFTACFLGRNIKTAGECTAGSISRLGVVVGDYCQYILLRQYPVPSRKKWHFASVGSFLALPCHTRAALLLFVGTSYSSWNGPLILIPGTRYFAVVKRSDTIAEAALSLNPVSSIIHL